MKCVEVTLEKRKVKAYLINRTYRKIRKKKIGDKEYCWEERFLIWYIPKDIKSKKFLVIPLNGEKENEKKE